MPSMPKITYTILGYHLKAKVYDQGYLLEPDEEPPFEFDHFFVERGKDWVRDNEEAHLFTTFDKAVAEIQHMQQLPQIAVKTEVLDHEDQTIDVWYLIPGWDLVRAFEDEANEKENKLPRINRTVKFFIEPVIEANQIDMKSQYRYTPKLCDANARLIQMDRFDLPVRDAQGNFIYLTT